ncbi:MAG: META domain-containing protein [Ktedonobacterales bacterium]
MHDSSSVSPGPTPLCLHYRPQLTLLRTRALSPREAAAVNEHIASCSWCQRELAAYDALDAAARQHLASTTFVPLTLEDIMHTTEAPPDANMASTLETSGKVRPVLRRRPRLATLGPLAAVVALVLLASVIFAGHRLGPGGSLGGKPTPPSLTQTASLTHTTWTLTRLMVAGHEQPLVPGHAPTLHFGPFNGQIYGIRGTGGCNGYGGTYALAGNTLHVSSLYYQTQRACEVGGVLLTPQESAYIQALLRVTGYHLDGNTLTLTSADGSVQLTFRANG